MPEREFDHLPDELQFAVETADVLVVNIPRRRLTPSLFGFVRGLLELDLGAVGDDGDALRCYFCDRKRERVSKEVDPDGLPFRDRSAPEDSLQVLLAAHQAYRLSRLDGYFLCIPGLGLRDPDLIIDP